MLLELLWGGSKFLLDVFAVKLDQSDVGDGRKLGCKELLVVLEEPQGVSEGINWVQSELVGQDVDIELLVAPVDLQNLRESAEELVSLGVR